MKITGKVRVAILRKAQAADPATTTVKQIYDEVCDEFGVGVVSYGSVWRLIRDAGKELTGKKAASRERMARLYADPEFRAASSERMTRLNADPEFRAAASETMTRLNADPEFAARRDAAARETMTRLRADPEFETRRIAALRRRRAAAATPTVR